MASTKHSSARVEHKPDAAPQRSGNPDIELKRSGGAGAGGLQSDSVPDPEVTPRVRRRTFTAEYKLSVLRAAEACTERGARGALLRREGLYSSHLTDWRRELEEHGKSGLVKQRGPKPRPPEEAELVERLAKLEREKAALEARLKQAEFVIEVQKKVSQALGLVLANEKGD
jgi:transposase-like protein